MLMNHVLRPVARRAFQRGTQIRNDSHHASHVKLASLDECPVPQGPWKDGYEKLQKKYNLQLVTGVGALIGTVAAILQFELLFFNFVPPKVLDVKDFKLE